MGVSTNTEVVDFTGGMNTVTARHLIAKQEAETLINVDIRNGSLLSMPEAKHITQAQASHFTEFLDAPYYHDGPITSATMNNNLYWANGVDTGKVLYDGRELPLGIATPTQVLTQVKVTNTPTGKHVGDFKYTYTFYSTDTGVESAPASLPSYITLDQEDVTLSNFEALPAEADRYRVYRIGGYLSTFTMVDEIEATQVPYVDSLDDTEIDGRILYSLRSGPPITGLNDLVELNGRLYGSVGAKVYYSALGNPDAWYAYDFFTMPDNITGMAKAPGGLLIFGIHFTYLLSGGTPMSFKLKVVSNKLGCVARESIAYIQENVIWLGTTGIYSSNGYQITNLTADKISNIGDILPTSACVVNEVYYLHFTPTLVPSFLLLPSDTLYPLSSTGVGVLDSGIISMDFKRGQRYSYNLFDYEKTQSIGVLRGSVHTITGEEDLVYIDCTLPLMCDEYLTCSPYDLNILGTYNSKVLTELSYLSPQFIDGSLATLKQYDKVRFNVWGEFDIKVIFSDGAVAVADKLLNKDSNQLENLLSSGDIELTEDNVIIVGIPNDNNNSYSIAFDIQGVGVIKSIQYTWKNREIK